MQSTKKLFLLAIVVTFAIAYAVAAPAPQAGQDIRITNGPILEEVTGNAVVIAWSTDVPSNSRVWYATDKNNLTHVAESPENGTNTHRVRIDNLRPNTTYYFQVESSQRGGNRGQGESEGVLSFRTLSPGAQTVRNQTPVVAATDVAASMQENGKVRITNGPVIEEVDHQRTDRKKRPLLAERAPRGLRRAPALRERAHQLPVVQRDQRDDRDHQPHRRQQQPQMVRSEGQGQQQGYRRQRGYGQQVGSGAVDHPMMREAQQALQQARNNLQQAAPQFAGHREKALEHVNLAMQEINAALQFAAQQGTSNPYNTANDQGYVQPMSSSANNTNYPRMTDAQRALEQARNALQQASNQFGAHKQNALQHIDQALQEINLGIQAAGQR